jgi:RNA polymerase sigma factor (sigma-70 family)
MEASALTHATRGGLLGRRSPLLKLQGDERLVALIRAGNEHAFETLFERYHSRLLAFCRHMLRSQEDAEDVLQEVFVKAHAAMLRDERPINARPWLYRIARNRCLNHLRRPVPEGQDSMDVMPADGGATTAERVQTREEFRALVGDVGELPETQRTALLLREIDALSYEEIATTMDTTIPAVKSLLVRARVSLAEASQSRHLTCGEVQLELAEAAEGLRRASAPTRHHLKRCEPCREFRGELRRNEKTLSALAPIGPLAVLHQFLIGKVSALFGGSGAATGGATGSVAATSGAVATGGAAAGGAAATGAATGGGAMLGGAAAAGGIGGALGAKAAATAATAALLTAGAVEVRHIAQDQPEQSRGPAAHSVAPQTSAGSLDATAMRLQTSRAQVIAPTEPAAPVTEPEAEAATIVAPTEPPAPAPEETATDSATVGPAAGGTGEETGTDKGAGDPATDPAPQPVSTPIPVSPVPRPMPQPTQPAPAEPAPATSDPNLLAP